MDRLQAGAKAQARKRVAAARAEDQRWREFRNVIIGLQNVEYEPLVDAGIIPDRPEAWTVFRQRPADFFLTLPDDLCAKLFDLAKRAAP